MIYNVSMKIQHLLENEQAVQMLQSTIPGLLNMVRGNPQAVALSVEQLIRYSRVPQADMLLGKLNAALQELNTPENAISPSEAKQIAFFKEIWQQEQQLPQKETCHRQDATYPGQPWLDTKGERIQAHGGAVYYENGTYYWYGENKTYTDGKNGIWTWGLKVYASQDLCNWDDLGYLIPPVLDDPNSALFPTKRVDRPHILKCPKTGKYVCWIKLSGPEAAFTIWQADSLLGPYEMVENLYNPGGHKAGDFDMIADTETGKGYIYFDADHKSMLCMSLTEDYLHADAEIASSYPNMTPPFTREAPALFEAKGKKYLVYDNAANKWHYRITQYTGDGTTHYHDLVKAHPKNKAAVVVNVFGAYKCEFSESTGGKGKATGNIYDLNFRDWYWAEFDRSMNFEAPEGHRLQNAAHQRPRKGQPHVWRYIPDDPAATIKVKATDVFGNTIAEFETKATE